VPPAGPFEGRDAIAADYAWAADGRRAGRIVLTPHGGEIAALTVTFE
jgi:NAD(P)H-hydrate repair Nnr-like enzyme with NAD(P)H-hydrate dehydratase domain